MQDALNTNQLKLSVMTSIKRKSQHWVPKAVRRSDFWCFEMHGYTFAWKSPPETSLGNELENISWSPLCLANTELVLASHKQKNCWAFAFIEVINDSQNLAFEGFLSSHVWWLLRAKRIDFNDLKSIPELYFKNSALQTLLLRQLLANHPTNQCHSNWNLVTFQILRGILVSMPPFQVKSSLGCSNGPHLRAAAICHQSEILRSDLCHLRTTRCDVIFKYIGFLVHVDDIF